MVTGLTRNILRQVYNNFSTTTPATQECYVAHFTFESPEPSGTVSQRLPKQPITLQGDIPNQSFSTQKIDFFKWNNGENDKCQYFEDLYHTTFFPTTSKKRLVKQLRR